MDELGQFLQDLITEGNGTLGIVSWGLAAILIKAWEDWRNKQMSNEAKRWVSIGVPAVLVALGYFGGIAAGYWAFELNTLFLAGRTLVTELGGAKVIFTATKSVEAAVVTNKV